MNDSNVDLVRFKEFIKIPAINFDYNNQEFDIHSSKIILGNSDFSLKGKIQNIGEWLDNTGLLEGELDFVSDNTDFNEIIDLTSGWVNLLMRKIQQSLLCPQRLKMPKMIHL